MRTSVGSGFAAAVLPVVAQTTIKTDTAGLVAGEVTHPGRRLQDAGLPRRAGWTSANAPVVLVISEIFGVHEHIADVARRFAKQGYFAIAPELFVRQGDAQSYGEISKLIAEVVSQDARRAGHGRPRRHRGLGRAAGRGRQPAGHHRLLLGRSHRLAVRRAQPGAEGRRGLVRSAAGRRQPGQPEARRSTWSARSRRRCWACTAGQDPGIPLASVAAMQEALATGSPAARRSKFVVFPDAPHAFHADYRPSYRKAAAEEGWSAGAGLVQDPRRGLTGLLRC